LPTSRWASGSTQEAAEIAGRVAVGVDVIVDVDVIVAVEVIVDVIIIVAVDDAVEVEEEVEVTTATGVIVSTETATGAPGEAVPADAMRMIRMRTSETRDTQTKPGGKPLECTFCTRRVRHNGILDLITLQECCSQARDEIQKRCGQGGNSGGSCGGSVGSKAPLDNGGSEGGALVILEQA